MRRNWNARHRIGVAAFITAATLVVPQVQAQAGFAEVTTVTKPSSAPSIIAASAGQLIRATGTPSIIPPETASGVKAKMRTTRSYIAIGWPRVSGAFTYELTVGRRGYSATKKLYVKAHIFQPTEKLNLPYRYLPAVGRGRHGPFWFRIKAKNQWGIPYVGGYVGIVPSTVRHRTWINRKQDPLWRVKLDRVVRQCNHEAVGTVITEGVAGGVLIGASAFFPPAEPITITTVAAAMGAYGAGTYVSCFVQTAR